MAENTIDEFFPSKWWKASDFADGPRVLVMRDLQSEVMEIVKKERKAVVYFEGEEKGLVLNVTNKNTIVNLYGPVFTKWYRQPIELFAIQIEVQGELKDAVRVRQPKFANDGLFDQQPTEELVDERPDFDDDIDFG